MTEEQQIKKILFDFWSDMRDEESNNRDNHIEKATKKLNQLLKTRQEKMVEDINKLKVYTGGSSVEPKDYRLNKDDVLNLIKV